jgi:hypothetical protein
LLGQDAAGEYGPTPVANEPREPVRHLVPTFVVTRWRIIREIAGENYDEQRRYMPSVTREVRRSTFKEGGYS